MLDNLRYLVAFEEQRANNLTSRGTGLAGFASLAVAVLAVSGPIEDLPNLSRIAAGLATVLLVAAVGGVVLGMFTTRASVIQSTRQVALYRRRDTRAVSPGRLQVQMVDVLVSRLEHLRSHNRTRASWLNRSALILSCGVVSSAVAAVARFAS